MFQPNLIAIFNFLRNYSRQPPSENKGNMTLKRLRSRQIETKSLMGRRVSSSLVVASKSAYILYWINKVLIKFPSRRNTQIIIVINKYVEAERVERCSGVKKSCEAERKQVWPEKWVTYVRKLSLKLNFPVLFTTN